MKNLHIAFRHSLVFKIFLSSIIFSIFIIGAMYLAFTLFNKQEIQDTSFNTTILAAEKIDIQLKKQLSSIQVLATTLANLGSTMQADHEKNKKVLKKLVNLQGFENLIAGGGIWPEPYAFDITKKRSSYFYGRNKRGTLDFYNDYNKPDGNGYHNEEWYVPLKYYKEGYIYWSKSYVDPYSLEPMVTASAPIYRDGVFIGVSTIDIMLNGLNEFLRKNIKALGGYGFITDRNNKLLSFPPNLLVKKDNEYINFNEVAKLYPSYEELKNAIQKATKQKLTKESEKISTYLEKNSVQISVEEAKIISHLVNSTHSKSNGQSVDLKKFIIKKDPLLQEEAIALKIHNNNTFWNLIIVIPTTVVLSQSNRIYDDLIITISLALFIGVILIYFIVRILIVRPISSIIKQLNDNRDNNEHIELKSQDEFGLLAYRFNEKIDQSIASAKAKEAFLANMSHELRTPLNSIIGFSSILNKKQKNESNKELSSQINSSANTLLELISDILDLSKINNSDFSIDPYTFNAYDEMMHVIEQFEGLFHTKNLRYETNISDSLKVTFYADWKRISQIILNLISNAIKFTPENGKITFSCEFKDDTLILCVTDTGIGMSKKVQNKVFKPFEQADGSTTRKYGGTGLGLSITHNLVQLMDGKIELYSKKGKGTKFTISLPLKVHTEEIDKKSIKPQDNTDKEDSLSGHLLIVEDNKTNQMLIKLMVGNFGLSFDIANDGLEAVDIYDPDTHKIILMDENMPNMNGLEAMKKIKSIHGDKTTSIVALTANAMHGDREKFLAAGMDEYVSKPIDEDRLYNVLKKFL